MTKKGDSPAMLYRELQEAVEMAGKRIAELESRVEHLESFVSGIDPSGFAVMHGPSAV